MIVRPGSWHFLRVDPRILNLAEQVIQQSDSAHPADAVLRVALKNHRDLSPKLAAEISRMVFSYFRWKGWINGQKGLRHQISHALELADEYKRNPTSFSDTELIARAVPDWICQEIPCTPELIRALQSEPKLWLRARPGQGRRIAQRLGDCRVFGPDSQSDILEYCGSKDLFRTPEFHTGDFEVQDLSSQAVGLSCAPEQGQTWWDACAGEGGKLLHLSDLMRNTGLIWASDRAEWRLRRLKRRAARARVFNYRAKAWNGGAKLPTRTRFDGVLVDAPCSGTGTWQRNPHARWTLTAKDISELAQLQLELLTNACASVKPAGKLMYSVCSLVRAETTKIAAAFESRFLEFTPLTIHNPLALGASSTDQLFLRPQDFGGNGMFIAVWKRRSQSEKS